MQIPLRMRKELNICPALPIMTKKQGITMPAIMKKICSTKRTAKPENSNTQKRQTISSRCRTLFRAARNRQSSGAAAKKGMGAPMFPFLFAWGGFPAWCGAPVCKTQFSQPAAAFPKQICRCSVIRIIPFSPHTSTFLPDILFLLSSVFRAPA